MLGQAYEYLLRNFADESGKKAGEFFTPGSVVHLLAGILNPQASEEVYDPAFMRNCDVSRDTCTEPSCGRTAA
jgi:type I restriction-modification system DNA methylase subunit